MEHRLETNDIEKLKIDLAVLKKHFEIEIESRDKAMELQAKEYSRRLDILNGEAERLRCMQATYLPRETYVIEHKRIADDVKNLIEFKDVYLGKMSVVVFILPIITSLAVSLAIHWLLK